MRVTSIMLADAATLADGRLYVHGGGWLAIPAPRLPHRALFTLVLAFDVEPHEMNTDCNFIIELLTEDADVLVRGETTIRTAPRRDAQYVYPATSLFTKAFELTFKREGAYFWAVRDD